MTKLSLMLLIILLAMGTGLMAGTYSGGDGTAETPYKINDWDDLLELSGTNGPLCQDDTGHFSTLN